MDEVLKGDLEQMPEEQDGLEEAKQLRRNLEEEHVKKRENVKRKIAK